MAAVWAWVGSGTPPLAPVGVAKAAEVAPGFAVDLPVLLLGAE